MLSNILIKLLIFLIGGLITSLIFCPPCFSISLNYAFDTLRYYCIIFAILWEVNARIIKKVDQQLDWITKTRRKILVNIGWLFIVTIPIILGYVFIVFEVIGPRPLNVTTFSWMTYYSLSAYHFFTGLLISLLLNSQNFFHSWKKSILREEALAQQQVTYQLKALVNQVNPHFLFNNLHTLTALVRKDEDLAEQFINQLAKVYRYLLQGNKAQAVLVQEEKVFLEAYFFLLKIRFDDCILIEFENLSSNFKVAPITLQMLIENAIKHNIANKQKPLRIQIYELEDYLVVKNNLQLKSSLGYTSGIGLKNILQRYELLSNRKVIIEENNEHFIVKLPNLSML